MKTKTKIIFITILIFIVLVLFEQHKDQQRANYAQTNNCTWTIYGAHDICK